MITISYVLTPLMNKKKLQKCQQKNMLLLRTIEMYILPDINVYNRNRLNKEHVSKNMTKSKKICILIWYLLGF